MCSQSFSSAVVLILTASLCLSNLAKARCNQDRWFGTNCQYQCHCAQSTACDKVDGSCSSGCDPQWFGPACQYASIRLNESNWLTDNNDTTCYPNNGGTSIDLSLATPVPLTWIRVVHKGNVNELRIMYKKDEQSSYQDCQDNATVVVDDHTMDFNCTTSHAVQKIYVDNLYGGFKSLCSLYISGGRNVALKQPTRQSTRFVQYFPPRLRASWYSKNAVDGRLPDSTLQSTYGTCAHTRPNKTLNWWTVNFKTPVDVTRILIHNRKNCCLERLKKFILTALQNGIEQYNVTGPDEERIIYSVVPSPKISSAVTQIKIQSRQKEILTLCEVEVFGELRCPTGQFGLACERECHFDNQSNCFVHSGRCKAGCAPGYRGATCSEICQAGKYGRKCSQNCSQHCKGGKTACNHIDGKCDEYCGQGTYGHMCLQNCSQFCHVPGVCNNVDGKCTGPCQPGYQNPQCNEDCGQGTYGHMCLQSCSQFCHVPGVCNHVDGKCTGPCQPGYQNPQCNEVCDFGMYGENCSKVCSRFCLRGQKPCHHVTGVCAQGCISGYRGEKCVDSCIRGTYGPSCNETCGYCKIERKLCDVLQGICFYGCMDGYKDAKCKTACDKGWFGENCENPCSHNCFGQNKEDKVCDHETGNCPKGCIDGFLPPTCENEFACKLGTYGKNCSQTCSKHCAGKNKPCDNNGTCVYNCEPGFLGLKCDTACEPGKFGFQCEDNCSQNCAGDGHPCNIEDGKCTHGCKAGFKEPFCGTVCDEGRYGVKCAFKCSPNCKRVQRVCSHKTGTCLQGCVDGYRNAQCDEECPRGTYGQRCSKRCSDKCGKAVNCDPIDGSCHYTETKVIGCPWGTYGPRCSLRCDFCDKSECDPINGKCVHTDNASETVVDGDCNLGKYGENCTLNCSDHCGGTHKACDYKTGHCRDECEAGYEGDKCDQVSTTEQGILGINFFVAMGFISLVIFFCAALFAGVFENKEERIEKPQGIVPEGVRDKNAMMSRVNKEDKVIVLEVNNEKTIDVLPNMASEALRWYGGKLKDAKVVPVDEAPLNVDERSLSPPVSLDKRGGSDSSKSSKSSESSNLSSSYSSISTAATEV